jgi:SAM-dependent methyltransferase
LTTPQQRWTSEHRRYDLAHVRLRQVARLLMMHNAHRVLDIGCATGHLRQLLPAHVEYVGCDFAFPGTAMGFEFHAVDLNLEALPDGIGGFDTIVCSGILEYLASRPRIFHDAARRLRTGGRVVCTYVNDSHVLRRMMRTVGLRPYAHPDWQTLADLPTLRAELTEAGLEPRGVYASTFGVGNAPAVQTTVHWPDDLKPLTALNRSFAHQLLIDCVRTA